MFRRVFHRRESTGLKLVRHGGFLLLAVFVIAQMTAPVAAGPWRAEEDNTPGWALMTPEERIEHQAIVRGFRNYEACRAYQLAHHQLMEDRAKQRALPLPRGRHDFCARLRTVQDSGPE
jgi:hypothetical protein